MPQPLLEPRSSRLRSRASPSRPSVDVHSPPVAVPGVEGIRKDRGGTKKIPIYTGRITKSLSWRLEVYLKYITGKLLGKTWQRMTLAGGDNEKLENCCGTAKKNW